MTKALPAFCVSISWTFEVIRGLVDPGILDRLGVERGDRGGGVLQIGIAAQRGDDDLALVSRGSLALRQGRRCTCQRQRRRRSCQKQPVPQSGHIHLIL